MAFFRRLVKRSKGEKCADFNYFDTPTLTGRGKHGKNDNTEPLAALYPNYRNVLFSRLDQDFTPFMELPKTFRIALPSGQIISREFPSNTSVYEVVSKLACEYDFDPTRVVVSHNGEEIPPSAVLLADISHNSVLSLGFRSPNSKQGRRPTQPHPIPGSSSGSSTGAHAHKYNTAPQKHFHLEMNNNGSSPYSMEKGASKKQHASGDLTGVEGGPPQQIKVDVTIPELSNKMVIRISPLLTCRDLLNIVCHAKKLEKSQCEIRLASSGGPGTTNAHAVAASTQPIHDISRLVVTVGQSFVVCQAPPGMQPTPSPRMARSQNQQQPHQWSSDARKEMSAPGTPQYGTKEKKKRLSFFSLMKQKRNKNDELLYCDTLPTNPDSSVLLEKRKKLHHSPSLDGVLDEQQMSEDKRVAEPPLFGSSSDVNQPFEIPFDLDSTPMSSSLVVQSNLSSNTLQSFTPVSTKFQSVENVYPSNESLDLDQDQNQSSRDNLSISTISSGANGSASRDTGLSYQVSYSTSLEAEATLLPSGKDSREVEVRKKSSKSGKSNLRVMSYSSTPDIANDFIRKQTDTDRLRNASLKLESRSDDFNLNSSCEFMSGPTAAPRKNSITSTGPPRRKAPPPPPKKTATLSNDDCYSMQSNGTSIESLGPPKHTPPAIPKRITLEEREALENKYKTNPVPRMSSMQSSRGEVPPSVAKMRQKQTNNRSDQSRRLTVTTISPLVTESTQYIEDNSVSLIIPPPPQLSPPTNSSSNSKRPLSTCESTCSCMHASHITESNVDLCSQCCSCRSSTVTLLPDTGDEIDNVSDVISVRSETSSLDHFGVEMDNLVAMAEFALSENNLEDLSSPQTPLFNTTKRVTSAMSLDEASSGQATPKATTPVNVSAETMHKEDNESVESLKSIHSVLQNRLRDVEKQLIHLGEQDWLFRNQSSRATQTEDLKLAEIEPPPKFNDSKNERSKSSGKRNERSGRSSAKSSLIFSNVEETPHVETENPVLYQEPNRDSMDEEVEIDVDTYLTPTDEFSEDAFAEQVKLRDELTLYVPEPGDHDFYISFGNPSPSPGSPKQKKFNMAGLSNANDNNRPSWNQKPKLKQAGSMENLSSRSSVSKKSAPKPPRTRSVSNLDVTSMSLNTSFDNTFDTTVNSTRDSSFFDAYENCEDNKDVEKSPKKIVPGAVKAKRALFETYANADSGLNNFRVRKHTLGNTDSGYHDKQRFMKAASTSDLTIPTYGDAPRVAPRYRKNVTRPSRVIDSATVGRPNRHSESPNEMIDSDDKIVAKMRSKFSSSETEGTKPQFGSKMNHLL